MSTGSSIDAPLGSARSTSNSVATSKSSKSMLRNLFAWKKTSSILESDPVISSDDSAATARPQTSASTQQPSLLRKPSLSHRSRSENAVPQRSKTRSKSRRRSRSRCRAVWDPPPLFQAYNQAFMNGTILVPNRGFLDWLPRNTSSRSSAKNSDSMEDERDEIEYQSISHRRSMSDSHTSTLSKKLFFLFENGHVLQYKADGSHDRLPERVLELSRDSVAFASDAVEGQHWVLEICPQGRAESEAKPTTPKLSWSRMTFRTQDTKRLSEKLLLVFESPNELFNWLFAIRKQIEGFGGIEYQPDAPPVPQLDLKRQTLRHASSEYFRRKNESLFSRSTSALPLRLDDRAAHEKDLPQIPATLAFEKSVSVRSADASSVATTTSLEQFRESYSRSSTAGTALSSGVSATSSSPITEVFPPLLSPVLNRDSKGRTNVERSMPRTPTSPLHNFEARSPTPDAACTLEQSVQGGSSLPSTDPVRNQLYSEIEDDNAAHPEVYSAGSSRPRSRDNRISTLEPLPASELKKRLKQVHRNISATDVDADNRARSSHLTSKNRHHARKSSLGGASKATYGLFPRNQSLDIKAEPLVILDKGYMADSPDTSTMSHPNISNLSESSDAWKVGSSFYTRSHTTLKRPAALGLAHLLAPIKVEQPMRSPAVTDSMLDSNFGIVPSGAMTEPATPIEIRVPSLSAMKLDKKLLESLRQIEPEDVAYSTSLTSPSVGPRRSMPNFHYGSAGTASAPVGPPPSVPLPAVPPVNEGRNSRTSTPSKRASIQSTANRRASTKSVSSTKKVRSPPPSFVFPAQQTRESRSASIKSPSTLNLQDVSPFLTSLPIPSSKDPPSTIGQVSVVSRLPRTSSLAQHRKALSTSSTKSGRQRAHTRSDSIRSLHDSITTLPPITRLISPPCGLGLDSDYASAGCFGINTSRSGS